MAHFLDGIVPDAEDVKPNLRRGQTRLQQAVDEKKRTTATDKQFKATVWTRDRKRCRCCGRKVLHAMGRVPERGEVHHLHGRGGELRFEARAAVLVCLTCHEKLTGKVNEKWQAVGTVTFLLTDKRGRHDYTDARFHINFRRVA